MARFSGRLLADARVRAARHYHPTASSGSGTPGALLRPTRPGFGVAFHVAPATAKLISALRTPARIPATTANRRSIARLVLDGLLEIEVDGRFRSGPRLHRAFFPGSATRRAASPLAQLSLDALAHAAALWPVSSARLADRLYRYHARPLSPAWRSRFPDDGAILRFLLGEHRESGRRVRHALPDPASYVVGRWLVSDSGRSMRTAPNGAHYKLYVSPTPEGTPVAYRAMLDLRNARHGPFTLKVGRDLPSLLRPDRLVGYFTTRDDLFEAAARLRTRLDGLPAQGVPFTAPTGPGALLSWGADLAPDANLPMSLQDRSWRGWVTSRLAKALASALACHAATPVQYALDRLSLDGVDTSTWAPTTRLLRQANDVAAHADS